MALTGADDGGGDDSADSGGDGTSENTGEVSVFSAMEPAEAARLFRGELDASAFGTREVLEFETERWRQHCGVLENFARHLADGTPLLAPGTDGIHGVRLANAIHLSSWLGREVSLDFDEDLFLGELNRRILAEGKYPPRA